MGTTLLLIPIFLLRISAQKMKDYSSSDYDLLDYNSSDYNYEEDYYWSDHAPNVYLIENVDDGNKTPWTCEKLEKIGVQQCVRRKSTLLIRWNTAEKTLEEYIKNGANIVPLPIELIEAKDKPVLVIRYGGALNEEAIMNSKKHEGRFCAELYRAPKISFWKFSKFQGMKFDCEIFEKEVEVTTVSCASPISGQEILDKAVDLHDLILPDFIGVKVEIEYPLTGSAFEQSCGQNLNQFLFRIEYPSANYCQLVKKLLNENITIVQCSEYRSDHENSQTAVWLYTKNNIHKEKVIELLTVNKAEIKSDLSGMFRTYSPGCMVTIEGKLSNNSRSGSLYDHTAASENAVKKIDDTVKNALKGIPLQIWHRPAIVAKGSLFFLYNVTWKGQFTIRELQRNMIKLQHIFSEETFEGKFFMNVYVPAEEIFPEGYRRWSLTIRVDLSKDCSNEYWLHFVKLVAVSSTSLITWKVTDSQVNLNGLCNSGLIKGKISMMEPAVSDEFVSRYMMDTVNRLKDKMIRKFEVKVEQVDRNE